MSFKTMLVYGPLFLAMAALWSDIRIKNKIDLWLIFLFVTAGFGLYFGNISFVSLIYIFLFGGLVFLFYRRQTVLGFMLILVLSLPLLSHASFTGFHNFRVLDAIKVTPDALPFSLYLNFDKTLIGLFLLGFGHLLYPLDLKKALRPVPAYLLALALLLMGAALLMGYARISLKIPSFILIWALVNLFFVCHAEEALFRGLIQKKLQDVFSFRFGNALALFIAAMLFGFAHYKGGPAYILLATLAGLFYGHIFQKTKTVASSILLHFSFNLLHLLLFTYPALAR